jgi:hypothetical protein
MASALLICFSSGVRRVLSLKGGVAVVNIAANRSLLALVLVHAGASLVHFAHNATFLADYPNMPAWLSPAGVYAVWLAQAAIGATGVLLFLRGRSIGLALIALYAVLGFAGLDHYVLAPISAHTAAMNATIWLETATGMLLLVFAWKQWRRRGLATAALRGS